MSHTITFGARMRKSYKVTLPLNMKFTNDRGAHVETTEYIPLGATYTLGERRVTHRRGNIVVMYDVVGIPDAHLTVYFGMDEKEAALH
jgi:hypothetical protein